MAEFDQSQHEEQEEAISLLWMDHSSLGRTRYERLGITVNKNQLSFLKKGGRAFASSLVSTKGSIRRKPFTGAGTPIEARKKARPKSQ
jgi:hypothetical protein